MQPLNDSTSDHLYGYLFAHFIGEQKNGEQIYFALSKDGLHWRELNHKQPVLYSTIGECGVRDPFLIRSHDDSRFYLLATDLSIYHRGGWHNTEATVTGSHSIIIWESFDLVNWSEPWKVEVAPKEAGCAWAPEAIYDEENDDFLVFWASSIGTGIHIYASKTRDFRTFTKPELYITRGEDKTIIDTTIIKVKDTYYRASGDGQITIEKSQHLMGDWEVISTLQSLGFGFTGEDVEGPQFFKFNGEDKWGLIVDQYATDKGYLPFITSDIGDTSGSKWQMLKPQAFSFGSLKKRHGTILPITKKEYDEIVAKWG
ncbi:glycoside hydrolase family 43 protein [Gracilibacillus suaedae]|uniref:glycoside hydrolase family 43 protein n=1 Tax=Gracilibacillus suaedae TaxID=2820273 RepID=UPI001ABED5A0|nr:glycoside hydrolase family 43 protein [Gracilibacillus suaedae]